MSARCERTATGVRTVRDGRILWNLEIDTPECRPFFHPLNFPSGRTITDLRPADHIWHLAAWFSWKRINGVLYWEPADKELRGVAPEGETRVVRQEIDVGGDASCDVRLELEYGPRGEKPVVAEKRTIRVSAPKATGEYSITIDHVFTALADVTFDRTPPHGDVSKGRWGGGYAGFTLRLDPEIAKEFTVHGLSVGDSPATCTGKETRGLVFTLPQTGETLRFSQLDAPETARFYIWPDKRMVNPSPVFTGPYGLEKGKTLHLAYRLDVNVCQGT